ncbi:MAG TPA: DUF4328 domain-containing protein [Acidimicrobiia bacterium]|nr:DUF4328 domain-containing protein [Acidimicrobiia bacterium]
MSAENAEQTQPELGLPPNRIAPGSPIGAGQFATAALAGIAAVEIISGLTAIVTLARIDARRAELLQSEPSFTDGWEAGLSLAYVGVFLIVVIAWMIWQHQAHANLRALTKARFSPAVVWFYLVPILGLILPYRGIAELAQAGNDRPAVRRTWWGAFLLSNALGGTSLIDPTISLATTRILSLMSSIASVVAAVLAMRIVSIVNTGLWARRALAGWPTGPRALSRRAKLAWSAAAGTLTLASAFGFGIVYPALIETLEQIPANNLQLAVGDCFNDVDGEYEVVSCQRPHYAEAYRVADHPDQAFYPGATRLADWAEPFCYRHFESYTGIAYQDSDLDFGYLYPTEGSWNGGDREVICFVFQLSGEDLTDRVGAPAV